MLAFYGNLEKCSKSICIFTNIFEIVGRNTYMCIDNLKTGSKIIYSHTVFLELSVNVWL